MRTAAQQQNTKPGFFTGSTPATTTLKSGLTSNAQPMGTTPVPGFDSNVWLAFLLLLSSSSYPFVWDKKIAKKIW